MDLFDLHCDTIYECLKTGQGLCSNSLAVSLERGQRLGRWCQCFAMFIPDEYRGDDAVVFYGRMRDLLLAEIERNGSLVTLCRSAEDITAANDAGKCAAILTVEGGAALGGSLEMLDRLYSDGVRMMTLTWNGDNELASGVFGSGGGLTEFGRRAVGRMNELGMLVDVSHLNERGFYEICDMGVRPIIASHSCFRTLHYHVRNLTDEQFAAIIHSGGIAGINFYNKFLGDSAMEDIYRNLSHALELGGEDNIAIGSDFDGAQIDPPISAIDKLNDLCDYLIGRNLSDKILNKLFYGNALRVFQKRKEE